MVITILDGFTLNPGDLSLAPLEALGKLRNFDRTPPQLTVERCQGANVVLTNKVVIDQSILEQLPELKFISILATGINVVDVEAASRHGVVVSNVPAYSTNSVAQHTFALMLELLNAVGAHNRDIREGGWKSRDDFSYTLQTINEMAGKTLGIVGWGAIARKVAEIAMAFGMRVRVFTGFPDDADVEFSSLSAVMASDIVSVHTSLTKEKEHMIDAEMLSHMPEHGLLINTSRGPLVHDEALAHALNTGRIRGAGVDVFAKEPPPEEHPLLHSKNTILTPHIAWTSKEAREELLRITAENIRGFQAGKPVNVVS